MPQSTQLEGICNPELRQSRNLRRKRPCSLAGLGYGTFNEINSQDAQPALGQRECKVACATANVQDWISRWILIKEGRECGLRAADVPGRYISIDGVEKGTRI